MTQPVKTATIRRAVNACDLAQVEALMADIFDANDHLPLADRLWWLARLDGKPVAFAGLRIVDAGQTGFLSLCGVLKRHRGHGIQRRLIVVRERYAASVGCTAIATYTMNRNTASSNSLIRCGYRLYDPAWEWAGPDAMYFLKSLKRKVA